MSLSTGAVLLVSLVLHGLLLAAIARQSEEIRQDSSWLLATALVSGLVVLVHLLPASPNAGLVSRATITALVSAILLILFGAIALNDMDRLHTGRPRRAWMAAGILWLVLLIVGLVMSPPIAGETGWLMALLQQPGPTSAILVGGIVIMGALAAGYALRTYLMERLPEMANRSLFWLIDLALLLLGLILLLSGRNVFVLAGLIAPVFALIGAFYACRYARVFDIRGAFSLTIRTLLLIALTAVVVFGALLFADGLTTGNDSAGAFPLILVALGAAVIYIPVRRLSEWLFTRERSGGGLSPSEATRLFSEEISKAVELEPLLVLIRDALIRIMRTRRALVLLPSQPGEEDPIELRVMDGTAESPTFRLPIGSPLYRRWVTERAPLSQFDLDVNLAFNGVTAAEREFFQGLRMAAYAPILVEQELVGLLACGPKTDDTPMYTRDLDLLGTLANQTGAALRSARMVSDLRQLNINISHLNESLEGSNRQLEKLDSVKTDFVTIASHELRTPLAQIRGYTDLMDALNGQGMLDSDQTRSMTGNLRRATERMEELIGAMLDVSQLDVNAMDLKFAPTALESVIKLALEPMTDAINQRKLTLTARGFRGLPQIAGDMQRLVQAFRNIVVNAIKFTPDSGRIEITASLQSAAEPASHDHILVAITDTGVGIAPENLDLIFQKFYRGHDTGLHSTGTYKFMGAGPGLGLTIARGVIEGHGGKIWAESAGFSLEDCPGTTFYVMLPVTPPETARRVMPFEATLHTVTRPTRDSSPTTDSSTTTAR